MNDGWFAVAEENSLFNSYLPATAYYYIIILTLLPDNKLSLTLMLCV